MLVSPYIPAANRAPSLQLRTVGAVNRSAEPRIPHPRAVAQTLQRGTAGASDEPLWDARVVSVSRAQSGLAKFSRTQHERPRLSVVPTPGDQAVDTPAVRAGRLYAEAQHAAFEQVQVLEGGLAKVVALAAEIAEGGDVYPAGVRDLCRRMSEDLNQRAQTLDAIAARTLDHAH